MLAQAATLSVCHGGIDCHWHRVTDRRTQELQDSSARSTKKGIAPNCSDCGSAKLLTATLRLLAASLSSSWTLQNPRSNRLASNSSRRPARLPHWPYISTATTSSCRMSAAPHPRSSPMFGCVRPMSPCTNSLIYCKEMESVSERAGS